MALQIRLTDRTRIETRRAKCAREGWLKSAWTNGYGLRKKKEALPLTGGLALHAAHEPILAYARDRHLVPSREEIQQLAQPAIDAFHDKIMTRGVDLGADPTDEGLVAYAEEQCALVAGLTYAFATYGLPQVLDRGRILEIEVEDVYVIGCTCGLGDGIGTAEQHDARECAGAGFMCRPDFISEDMTGNTLTYNDLKSTGWNNKAWADGWLYKIQTHVGALGAGQRLERKIDNVVFHGLYKGQRRGDYNTETGKYDANNGQKRQNSPFCYGYYREPNPPMWDGGWQFDQPKGKGAREWEKKGVGAYDGGYWGWIWQLPEEVCIAQLITVGPIPVNSRRIRSFLRQTAAEEQRWYEIETQLHTKLLECGGNWADQRYQDLLDDLIPQSNDCLRFGRPCDMISICADLEPGWEDPLKVGYELRRPHHRPELEAAISRGLALPDAEDEEEIDDQD